MPSVPFDTNDESWHTSLSLSTCDKEETMRLLYTHDQKPTALQNGDKISFTLNPEVCFGQLEITRGVRRLLFRNGDRFSETEELAGNLAQEPQDFHDSALLIISLFGFSLSNVEVTQDRLQGTVQTEV